MIINGKALVKALKEAKKYGGYRVYVDGACTVVYTGYWAVRCVTKRMPPNVFGRLAEDLMQWPENGECWYVTKGEAQKELTVNTLEIMGRLMRANGTPLRRTPLDIKGWELWQTTRELEMVAFDPALTALCTEQKPEYITTDAGEKVARWMGGVSTVWAFPLGEGLINGQALRFLEQMQWVEE